MKERQPAVIPLDPQSLAVRLAGWLAALVAALLLARSFVSGISDFGLPMSLLVTFWVLALLATTTFSFVVRAPHPGVVVSVARHRRVLALFGRRWDSLTEDKVGLFLGLLPGLALAMVPTSLGLWEGMPLSVLASLVTGAVVAWLANRPCAVTLTEGKLTVDRGWRRRTLPVRALQDVSLAGASLSLSLRDGTTESVALHGLPPVERERLADALYARVAQAPDAAALARTEALAPQGRTVAAWREALAGALRAGDGYRDVGLTREEALRTMTNPMASLERRVGAALALVASDGTQRERVRAAAERSDEPRVRAALEAAAEETPDDEQLERLLREEGSSRG